LVIAHKRACRASVLLHQHIVCWHHSHVSAVIVAQTQVHRSCECYRCTITRHCTRISHHGRPRTPGSHTNAFRPLAYIAPKVIVVFMLAPSKATSTPTPSCLHPARPQACHHTCAYPRPQEYRCARVRIRPPARYRACAYRRAHLIILVSIKGRKHSTIIALVSIQDHEYIIVLVSTADHKHIPALVSIQDHEHIIVLASVSRPQAHPCTRVYQDHEHILALVSIQITSTS